MQLKAAAMVDHNPYNYGSSYYASMMLQHQLAAVSMAAGGGGEKKNKQESDNSSDEEDSTTQKRRNHKKKKGSKQNKSKAEKDAEAIAREEIMRDLASDDGFSPRERKYSKGVENEDTPGEHHDQDHGSDSDEAMFHSSSKMNKDKKRKKSTSKHEAEKRKKKGKHGCNAKGAVMSENQILNPYDGGSHQTGASSAAGVSTSKSGHHHFIPGRSAEQAVEMDQQNMFENGWLKHEHEHGNVDFDSNHQLAKALHLGSPPGTAGAPAVAGETSTSIQHGHGQAAHWQHQKTGAGHNSLQPQQGGGFGRQPQLLQNHVGATALLPNQIKNGDPTTGAPAAAPRSPIDLASVAPGAVVRRVGKRQVRCFFPGKLRSGNMRRSGGGTGTNRKRKMTGSPKFSKMCTSTTERRTEDIIEPGELKTGDTITAPPSVVEHQVASFQHPAVEYSGERDDQNKNHHVLADQAQEQYVHDTPEIDEGNSTYDASYVAQRPTVPASVATQVLNPYPASVPCGGGLATGGNSEQNVMNSCSSSTRRGIIDNTSGSGSCTTYENLRHQRHPAHASRYDSIGAAPTSNGANTYNNASASHQQHQRSSRLLQTCHATVDLRIVKMSGVDISRIAGDRCANLQEIRASTETDIFAGYGEIQIAGGLTQVIDALSQTMDVHGKAVAKEAETKYLRKEHREAGGAGRERENRNKDVDGVHEQGHDEDEPQHQTTSRVHRPAHRSRSRGPRRKSGGGHRPGSAGLRKLAPAQMQRGGGGPSREKSISRLRQTLDKVHRVERQRKLLNNANAKMIENGNNKAVRKSNGKEREGAARGKLHARSTSSSRDEVGGEAKEAPDSGCKFGSCSTDANAQEDTARADSSGRRCGGGKRKKQTGNNKAGSPKMNKLMNKNNPNLIPLPASFREQNKEGSRGAGGEMKSSKTTAAPGGAASAGSAGAIVGKSRFGDYQPPAMKVTVDMTPCSSSHDHHDVDQKPQSKNLHATRTKRTSTCTSGESNRHRTIRVGGVTLTNKKNLQEQVVGGTACASGTPSEGRNNKPTLRRRRNAQPENTGVIQHDQADDNSNGHGKPSKRAGRVEEGAASGEGSNRKKRSLNEREDDTGTRRRGARSDDNLSNTTSTRETETRNTASSTAAAAQVLRAGAVPSRSGGATGAGGGAAGQVQTPDGRRQGTSRYDDRGQDRRDLRNNTENSNHGRTDRDAQSRGRRGGGKRADHSYDEERRAEGNNYTTAGEPYDHEFHPDRSENKSRYGTRSARQQTTSNPFDDRTRYNNREEREEAHHYYNQSRTTGQHHDRSNRHCSRRRQRDAVDGSDDAEAHDYSGRRAAKKQRTSHWDEYSAPHGAGTSNTGGRGSR
ncbi:unnamed protein product [Amoebophrya sp. A120]|nr:unnamed protein product [Amoebophrya sp. A120]|eukprot:GSA120T00023295001.1